MAFRSSTRVSDTTQKRERKREMKGPFIPTWGWTLITQILLCCALFIAFNIGDQPQISTLNYNIYTMKTRGDTTTTPPPLDLYFISVRGGFRPLNQQTHLLKQMEKVAKIYGVKFVIDISELGEEDHLMQNGTLHFPSLKVPWYTTNVLQRQEKRYIREQFILPHGKILDLIIVDTGSLQTYLPKGRPCKNENGHINWLTRSLEMSDSDWRIVVGYDSLLVCEEQGEGKGIKMAYESLYSILEKFGVNAYLSKQACMDLYIRKGSIAHIGNLGPADEFSPSSGSSIISREMQNGFYLHKVSLLEIVSYYVSPTSEVVFRSTLHRGKEFM